MKLLLWLALAFFAFWLLRKYRGADEAARPPGQRSPERMVRCEHCGVNSPASECVSDGGRYYCCPAHRTAAGGGAQAAGRAERDAD